VWPRADTIIWLDYPLVVSLWRLGRRALWRASAIRTETHGDGTSSRRKQVISAAKGVFTALRSHRGQRRTYPRMFAEERNRHLKVLRLRSPRATRRWHARVMHTQTSMEMETADSGYLGARPPADAGQSDFLTRRG
jgi:hypothetical protein